MCKPTHFDVMVKEQNVYMTQKTPVCPEKARAEHENLVKHLQRCDVQVKYIPPIEGLYDMVFTANGALLHAQSKRAVVANFSVPARVPESLSWEVKLIDDGYSVYKTMHKFEGQGDALFSHNGNHLWVGNGQRTEQGAVAELRGIYESCHVHSIRLVKPEFYHLDTCFCPLPNDKVMIYSPAFDFGSLQKIYSVYKHENVIDVCENDAMNFSCNAVVANDYVLMNNPSWVLIDELDSHGLSATTVPMSQFLLSGGSTKCCVLIEQ